MPRNVFLKTDLSLSTFTPFWLLWDERNNTINLGTNNLSIVSRAVTKKQI